MTGIRHVDQEKKIRCAKPTKNYYNAASKLQRKTCSPMEVKETGKLPDGTNLPIGQFEEKKSYFFEIIFYTIEVMI